MLRLIHFSQPSVMSHFTDYQHSPIDQFRGAGHTKWRGCEVAYTKATARFDILPVTNPRPSQFPKASRPQNKRKRCVSPR